MAQNNPRKVPKNSNYYMRLVIKNGLDVFDAISERRSVRKFKDEPVPYDSLLKILEAARLAPSAGNRQPWMFMVIKDREKKKELARASNNQLFMEDAGDHHNCAI